MSPNMHPNTRDYIYHFGLELLQICIIGLIALGLTFLPLIGARAHYFPYPDNGPSTSLFELPKKEESLLDVSYDTDAVLNLSYPKSPSLITTIPCTILAFMVPMFVVALFQVAMGSYWDFTAAALGLVKCGVLSYVVLNPKNFWGQFS